LYSVYYTSFIFPWPQESATKHDSLRVPEIALIDVSEMRYTTMMSFIYKLLD